jgi:hypothetical protein
MKMDSEKRRQKLRAKLGIPNPKPIQQQKSATSIQIFQSPKKGCCGK